MRGWCILGILYQILARVKEMQSLLLEKTILCLEKNLITANPNEILS